MQLRCQDALCACACIGGSELFDANAGRRPRTQIKKHIYLKNNGLRIISLRAIPTLHTQELTTVTTNSSASFDSKFPLAPSQYTMIFCQSTASSPFQAYWRVNKNANRYKRLMPQHGCVNSSRAYDSSTNFALRALSTCLCVKLNLSASLSRELLWRDTWRDPLASYSGMAGSTGGLLSFKIGGIYWRAALAGYSAGSTRRDPLASSSGGIITGIHWPAALAGYSAGSIGEPLWRDTRRDPLESRSGRILGGIHWGAALAEYSAGSTVELLWRDTRRDPLASRSGGILGGIHWKAALAGYSAGSTGEPLWPDTRRDPLASSSGGILGGIHWRAALAGYSAGSTGWVGAWCGSIADKDSNIKSNNPFLSGGEKIQVCMMAASTGR